MGNSQSSRADAKIKAPKVEHLLSESARGRKSPTGADHTTHRDLTNVEVQLVSTTEESDTDSMEYESEDEESDEEIDAGLAERRQILEDAKMLKQFATFHLHPEESVETTNPFVKGRNYFDRPSASEQESFEESEERARILEESQQLKMYANFHLHPENSVATTDVNASARNFFSRASAPQQESFEDAEERVKILEEAAMLKQYADFHFHPEKAVKSQVNPAAFGRNYFTRASADEHFTEEEIEEREQILVDCEALKQYAEFHLHPEKPVKATDSMACARNFFTRASADEYFDEETAEEREEILKEVAMLKQYAGYHLHPERSVETIDATACGRNFFTRASADEYFTEEEAEERELVLAECQALKQHAGYHLHPERPVESQGDAMSFGRNYFMRASAPEQESLEEMDERAQILEEAAMLKQYAAFHLHPETPVESTDLMACGRNYFTRASADAYFDEETAEEREEILKEVAMLKQYAAFHLHPERSVKSTVDATAYGRNFFGRASASEQETVEEAEERATILEETAMLKQYAGYHLHPEMPVETQVDAMSFGRNFFLRASAPEQKSLEEVEERTKILEEAAMLKQYAVFHLHPEKLVGSTVDARAFGRNFFGRASAPEQESFEEAEERAAIMAETAMLKQYANYHLHPEKRVESTDFLSCGRNYFSRASGVEYYTKEDVEDRDQILAETLMLKMFAEFHLHPESPVQASDASITGRNFFHRASAPTSSVDLVTSEGHSNSMDESEIMDESECYDNHVELDDQHLTNLNDFRASLSKVVSERLAETDYRQGKRIDAHNDDGEDEGNLSRSPSSIMLFGYEENAY